MYKITEKKYINIFVFLFVAVYFVSYITRINYGAVLVEIIAEKGITKTAASWVVTGSSITYGIGQLISGYLGDRIKPHWLIFTGLVTTSAMNFVFPFCSYSAMIFVWCINGFAQAMMWPPIVKSLTSYLTNEEYKKSSIKVSWGSSFGTIAVYLLVPVIIGKSSWESVFFICGMCAVVMAVVIMASYEKLTKHVTLVEETQNVKQTQDKKGFGGAIVVIFILAAIGIILQGILRDGITTWMPTYISEVYHLGSEISILTGVVLPIFSIISFQLTSMIYRSFIRNEFVCAGVIFFVGFVAATILALSNNSSAVLSVAMSALVTGCMHGVNVMLICMLPPYFEKYGKVSLMSGALNACTYVGAAISTYGMALISEKLGWGATVASWAVVALAGALICIATSKKWQKFKKQTIKELSH